MGGKKLHGDSEDDDVLQEDVEHEDDAGVGSARARLLVSTDPSSQGLRSGVSKHTRLQHGISDPGVPELVAYRKPVATFRRTGGLASLVREDDNLYKKIPNRTLWRAASRHPPVDGTGGWAGGCISP